MDTKQLAGTLKLAILVKSMGEDAGKDLLDALEEKEREMVMSHMEQIGNVSTELVEKVAREFTELVARRKRQRERPMIAEGKEKKEEEVPGVTSANLDTIQSLEPDQIVELIRDEHPQTIAVILVHLKTDIASQVLEKIPEAIQMEVALRIAKLEKVLSGMVAELDHVFADILKNLETSATHKTGGVNRLAEILNQISESSSEQILEEIEDVDPELVAQIKQRMFVFEDIVQVDNQGLQKVLRKVETVELAKALKGASEEAKEKVFSNMSLRASDILKEEIEALGAVRMKEVEDAQQAITRIMQEMESKGELIISGRRGEELIA
jgi:flagellar motor switch protein FliG